MEIFFSSFLVIFLAEMGDKTQIITMSFAAKYKLTTTISAIALAIIINSLLAVTAGTIIFNFAPSGTIQLISYVIFICFGIWTLLTLNDKGSAEKSANLVINPFVTIALFFTISEFADKTQLATMLLSIQTQTTLPVFLGAATGLFTANLIAIIIGSILGKKIPEKIIKIISSGIFILIGAWGITASLRS
jgi:putative Ca2+/H+ antiporter (TMEM165/GDT1 family)